MPTKTCPKCSCKHGPRKLVCDCGHDFQCKRPTKSSTAETYPEPGAWVKDKGSGFPEIHQPEPLPPGPLTTEEIQRYIQYEGLGFCVYSLIAPSKIKSQCLQVLWERARFAMHDIVRYLENWEENKGDE